MKIKPKAVKAIRIATVSAGGVAVSPIPFSDAALLVPIQMAMISGIYKAYDKKFSEGMKEGMTQATLAATIGKTVVGNAFKFIPGLGTITGGVINVAVATAITRMIGYNIAKGLESGEIKNNRDLLEMISSLASLAKVKK